MSWLFNVDKIFIGANRSIYTVLQFYGLKCTCKQLSFDKMSKLDSLKIIYLVDLQYSNKILPLVLSHPHYF